MTSLYPIFSFLSELQANNNRAWFHANKARYENTVKLPFEAFVTTLIEGLQVHDPSIRTTAKEAIFRINRDTRFSADKSPYKTNVGALISRYGRKNKLYPGFYIHLEPGSLMIGGGAYFLDRPNIEKIREAIFTQQADWTAVTRAPDFQRLFGDILGERAKRIPKHLSAIAQEHPEIANKQFYYATHYPATECNRPDIAAMVIDHFKAAAPVNAFLAAAMQD